MKGCRSGVLLDRLRNEHPLAVFLREVVQQLGRELGADFRVRDATELPGDLAEEAAGAVVAGQRKLRWTRQIDQADDERLAVFGSDIPDERQNISICGH